MPRRWPIASLSRQCLRQRRHFSTSPVAASWEPRQPDLPSRPPLAGHARLTSRALISITGADSAQFLQGMITQNILTPESKASTKSAFYAAFLNAQGRVLHDVFIYPAPGASALEPGYLIEVDKKEAKNLGSHIKKFKLRAKLNWRILDEGERSIWASWDERDSSVVAQSGGEAEWPLSCDDKRAPGFGYRTIAEGEFGDRERFLPGAEVSASTYELRRMLHGVPEGGKEIPSGTALPMDSNMDIMGGIDFHKGCYLGQELTIRTHHRGVVRKRILPVQMYDFDDPSPVGDLPLYSQDTELPLPPAGAKISTVGPRITKSRGKFLSGIGNIGLALCRLEGMTDITFTGNDWNHNFDEEFGISWEADSKGVDGAGQVKVKAFIPPWTKDYILRKGARLRTPFGEAQRGKEAVEELEGMIHQHEQPDKL